MDWQMDLIYDPILDMVVMAIKAVYFKNIIET